jgi:hypothetical protein
MNPIVVGCILRTVVQLGTLHSASVAGDRQAHQLVICYISRWLACFHKEHRLWSTMISLDMAFDCRKTADKVRSRYFFADVGRGSLDTNSSHSFCLKASAFRSMPAMGSSDAARTASATCFECNEVYWPPRPMLRLLQGAVRARSGERAGQRWLSEDGAANA